MKKIAVNTVKAFLKENKKDETTSISFSVGDSQFEVQIKTVLSEAEKSTFINRVLSGCFDSSDNFRPEYVTPMLRATILQMCTNLPVIALKDGQDENGGSLMDIGAMEALYEAMDLDHLNHADYQTMMNGMVHLCHAAIEWKKSRILAKDSAPDIDAFTAFGEAANTVRYVAETIQKQLKNADYRELLQYAEQLSKATEGMQEDSILHGLIAMHQAETKD